VYAYAAELDDWWNRRRHPKLAEGGGQQDRRFVYWLGLAIAAVFVSASVQLLSTRRAGREPFVQYTITRVTSTGRASRAAISADGRYLAYVVGDRGQHSIRLRNLDSGRDTELLPESNAEYGGLSFSKDGVLLYFNLTSKGEVPASLYRMPVHYKGDPQKIKHGLSSPAALSPDGASLTFIRDDRKRHQSVLVIADLQKSEERTMAVREMPGFLDYPEWSPDGSRIACTSVTPGTSFVQLVEIGVASAVERTISSQSWSYGRQLKWLPDGKGLLLSARESAGGPYSLWHVTYPGGKARKLTSGIDEFVSVSISADSTRVATVQDRLVSSLWIGPANDPVRGRQVAYDASRFSHAALAANGTIFLEKQEVGHRAIWFVGPGATTPKQLTRGGDSYNPSVCEAGPSVVYTCERDGRKGVCRMNQDGSYYKELVSNTISDPSPRCSPVGRFVVYNTWSNSKWPTAWTIPMDGGVPRQLTDKLCFRPAISPDGRWAACFYAESPSVQADPNAIAIIPAAGGAPLKTFSLPVTAYPEAGLRWTPDGSAIAYVDNRSGISNLWSQPLEGEPRQLTHFQGDRLFYFEWSPDGRQLAFSRGTRSQDVFLIRDNRW
jgi:Tol biopolymer transport system component